jgi:hypothetical protein
MDMDHRHPNDDKNHSSHSLWGCGSKIWIQNSQKWLLLPVFKFGFSDHSPAGSGNDGFCPHLDIHDPYASDVTLKSKIHPWMASAKFKDLFACLFLTVIRTFKP